MSRRVNTDVLEYFAFLHDACRINDGRDPGHGSRAAELARKARGTHVHLNDENFYKLLDALIGHSSQDFHDDPTIQACWDADRLDLGRIVARGTQRGHHRPKHEDGHHRVGQEPRQKMERDVMEREQSLRKK